jgi:hypothetical protein
MAEPRTTREALIAEMLGELGVLLDRCEAMPAAVATAEARLATSVAALNEASDKYRLAVTAFTHEARAELTEFLQRQAQAVAARTVDEQRAAMQDAAQQAFRTHASEKALQLGNALAQAAREFRRSTRSRLLEHGLTALLSSAVTAAVVVYLVR